MAQTRKVLKHIVRMGDNLEALALQYMGDAEQWLQLAILNRLDYPFVSDDETFARDLTAAGQVTFTRSTGSTDISIPAGTALFVPATANAPQRNYVTTQLVVLPGADASITAAVAAALSGEVGNTPALTITGMGAISGIASVNNLAAITGGATLRVKVPGDTLLVFTDDTGIAGATNLDTRALEDASFYASLLGTDLALDATGELRVDSRGGLALVSGVDNFRAALLRRLATPLGWYPYNEGYGSIVEASIGERGDPYRLARVVLDVQRTLRSDPRVADVQNVQARFDAGALVITLDILSIGETDASNLVLTLPGLGGS